MRTKDRGASGGGGSNMNKVRQEQPQSRRSLFRWFVAGMGAVGMTTVVHAKRSVQAREQKPESAAGYRRTARVREAYRAARF